VHLLVAGAMNTLESTLPVLSIVRALAGDHPHHRAFVAFGEVGIGSVIANRAARAVHPSHPSAHGGFGAVLAANGRVAIVVLRDGARGAVSAPRRDARCRSADPHRELGHQSPSPNAILVSGSKQATFPGRENGDTRASRTARDRPSHPGDRIDHGAPRYE
jgi:hypothetical protein